MAHSITHQPGVASVFQALGRGIASFGSAVFDVLVRLGEANSKVRQINALTQLSDEELAQRGLKREEIATYVLGPFV